MSKSQDNLLGQSRAESLGGEVGVLQSIVNGLIGRIQTVTLVQVVRVKSQGVEPVGFVDVRPLVSQINQSGQVVAHGVIHNIPFMRLQGGTSAVIIDPKVNDIGMCGFCSRDISSVKTHKQMSPPQSRRQFDWADGLFFGGFLNGTPEQYIQFHDSGIKIFSPNNIEIIGKNVDIVGEQIKLQSANAVQFAGGQGIQADGDVRTNNISVNDHTHPNVESGNDVTGKAQ